MSEGKTVITVPPGITADGLPVIAVIHDVAADTSEFLVVTESGTMRITPSKGGVTWSESWGHPAG